MVGQSIPPADPDHIMDWTGCDAAVDNDPVAQTARADPVSAALAFLTDRRRRGRKRRHRLDPALKT